jgi:hypothetical protein
MTLRKPESECCREGDDAPCGPFLDQEREIDRLRSALREIAALRAEDMPLADGCGFDNMAAMYAAHALNEQPAVSRTSQVSEQR